MADVNPKRLCPGCAARQLAMNAEPCAICGRVNLVTAPRPREKMNAFARFVRWMLRPLGWFTQTLTLVVFVGTIWTLALHGIVPFSSFLALHFFILFLALTWTTRLLARGIVGVFSRDFEPRGFRRPGARTFWPFAFCVLLAALLGVYDVPLRVAFRLSQLALEREARGVLSAPMFSTGRGWKRFVAPGRAGLYRVKRIDAKGVNVRFQVTDNTFIFSGTKAGFARCPQGCAGVDFPPLFIERNSAPQTIWLSDNWVWWEQSGSD